MRDTLPVGSKGVVHRPKVPRGMDHGRESPDKCMLSLADSRNSFIPQHTIVGPG